MFTSTDTNSGYDFPLGTDSKLMAKKGTNSGSFDHVDVKQTVSEFLHKCKDNGENNTTLKQTVSKATLCIENGLGQISGRSSFRSGGEHIPNTCRVVLSVLHCLTPLKNDIEKCSGKEEVGILILLEDLCKNGGTKIIEFEDGLECLENENKIFTKCLETKDEEKNLYNLQNTVKKPCETLSILNKCTEETLATCSTKTAKLMYKKYLNELENLNPFAFKCISHQNLTNEIKDSSSASVSSFPSYYYYKGSLFLFEIIILTVQFIQIF